MSAHCRRLSPATPGEIKAHAELRDFYGHRVECEFPLSTGLKTCLPIVMSPLRKPDSRVVPPRNGLATFSGKRVSVSPPNPPSCPGFHRDSCLRRDSWPFSPLTFIEAFTSVLPPRTVTGVKPEIQISDSDIVVCKTLSLRQCLCPEAGCRGIPRRDRC